MSDMWLSEENQGLQRMSFYTYRQLMLIYE